MVKRITSKGIRAWRRAGSPLIFRRKGRGRRNFGKWGSSKFSKKVKKVVLNLAETKFYRSPPIIAPVGNPVSGHTWNFCLLDADDITKGTGVNQRIGNSIQLAGIKLNLIFRRPTGLLLNNGVQDWLKWTKVKWAIVKYKTVPVVAGTKHFPDTVSENVKDKRLTSQDQQLTFIKSGTVSMMNQYQLTEDNSKEQVKTGEIIKNVFVPIKAKQDYTGEVSGNYRSNYYFIAYAYADRQGVGTTGYWCNATDTSTSLAGSSYYHPHIQLNYSVYYKDI